MEISLIYSWYEQYKNQIFRYALSILKDYHLAEDVLQETFLRLLSGKYMVQEEKVQAWLFKVARNCCYDIFRKQRREQEPSPVWSNQEGQYAYIERIAVLDRVEQEIVTLRVLSGMTSREIGQIMGMAGPTVQKRYERAMQKLKEQEENHGNNTEKGTRSAAGNKVTV